MATLTTADVTLPSQIVDGIVEKTKYASTISALSTAEPMRFGAATIVTFDEDLKAEFVEEGGAKSESDAQPSSVTAVPHKAVVNFRTSDEFKIADEEYQLGILDKFEEKCARALARALDLGVYFRVNPRTGNAISSWTNYLNSTSKRVEITTASVPNPDLDVEAAAGLLVNAGTQPTGVALDPSFSWKLATARFPNDGRKKFPELGYGVDVSAFEGLRASVSDTVSGRPESADKKVRAIVGDYQSGIRWGVQRTFPFRMLEFGDPDNTGRDLAGHNEVLFRAEVIYAWYVFADRFAVVEDATANV